MKMSRFFELFQVGALAVLAFLGLARAIWLSARGARVLVADRQRTGWQMLADAVMAGCLSVWAYEIVAYGCPLGFHIGPLPLGRIVVDNLAAKTLGAAVVGIGLLLYVIALHHLLGQLIFLLLSLGMAILLDGVMRREERFLTQLCGDAYRDYSRCVGRYCFRQRQ